jgi:micrococcal nuclease
MPALLLCIAATVIDGDSLRCRAVRAEAAWGVAEDGPVEVRLLAIDAPDRRSSRPCRGGYGDHVCNEAGARRASASLRRALSLGPVRLDPVTRDRYGRMVAMASAGGVDLSCYQLRAGVARYIARYDNGRRVARTCRR